MKSFVAALLFAVSCVAAGNPALNGRWDITVPDNARKRAWWLEVKGAETATPSGSFVGAPGGQLDKIDDLSIQDDSLRFSYKRVYRRDQGEKSPRVLGVYRARLVGDKLEGTVEVEGDPKPLRWTGVRAPRLQPGNAAQYREGQPVNLFNGKDLSGWQPMIPGRPMEWQVKDGILRNSPGAVDLVTTGKYWDFKLHVKYRIGPKSNSGIGLRGRYEVQIYDDHGQAPSLHGNGALYSRIPPSTNASKPPNEWQTFDITLVGNQLTVVLNGATILDRREVEGLTAIAGDPNEGEPGPIIIQGDHGVVEFETIRLTPLIKK